MKLNIVVGFVIFCAVITFCLYIYSSGNGESFMASPSYCGQISSLHDNAVSDLKNILSVMENNPNKYNKEIAFKLSGAIRILSLEVTPNTNVANVTEIPTNIASDFSSSQSTESTSTEQQTRVEAIKSPIYACPEKFRHAKYGDPFFMSGSWVIEDCGKVKPISEILSIVFTTSKNLPCSEKESQMILEIVKLYPNVPILIGAPKESGCPANVPQIDINKLSSKSLGSKLNSLISKVKTPLTLITRNLDDFNWLSRLERQLSVFSLEPRANIVGGSIRNVTGHWQAGCYQTELRNYILKYIEGYYKSQHECMYCDYLLGPFIAKTEFLNDHKFDTKMKDKLLFDDFFLSIKNSEGIILACPDVMYHSTNSEIELKINERKTWFPLTRKWTLNRIVLPNDVVHKFSCDESGVNCKSLASKVGAMMMPVCCRDALINGYKVFHEFSVKNGIYYQIEGGSALGAIKLNDVIPWDFDGDGSYYRDKMKLFTKTLNWSNSEGEIYVDHINYKAKGFFYVSTPDAFIEYWAVDKLSVDATNLTDLFHKTPTLIRIGDVWVYAPPSPGLYARNYYGYEILRHSNSYYHLGRGHWYSPYNVSDPFIRCKTKHHACLDQFINDGNIQFRIP